MMAYIWEQDDWTRFTWDSDRILNLLANVALRQGQLLGRMEGLGFASRNEIHLRMLTADVIKSSEIEGEAFNPEEVRSSIARRLGIDIGGYSAVGRDVEGTVEMMIDATSNYQEPLTFERLFAWHASLFPTGRVGMNKIRVGNWRKDEGGPMEVVSGPVGREQVHYQAPPADRVDKEIAEFLDWSNHPSKHHPIINASIGHFWFVTIHPFDDGNGRIARAIADLMLARCENSPLRFYSMSAQIRRERRDYYQILERSQQDSKDITEWHEWFLGCLLRSIESSGETLKAVIQKSHFWNRIADESLNARQVKVVNLLLDGFQGKLTSTKWATLTKSSQDTATRDINDLIDRNILRKHGGGRSTCYTLVEE